MSNHQPHFLGSHALLCASCQSVCLILLLISGKNLIQSSPKSADLIPGWSWYSLYHFNGLLSSLFEFWSYVSHVKACHTCYSVLLHHDQCRSFVYVNYLDFSICHTLW